LWSFDLTPVGVGLNCMDNREGGRIPDPEGVRPPCVGLSLFSIANFVNNALAARGITPSDVNIELCYMEYPFAKDRFVRWVQTFP